MAAIDLLRQKRSQPETSEPEVQDQARILPLMEGEYQAQPGAPVSCIVSGVLTEDGKGLEVQEVKPFQEQGMKTNMQTVRLATEPYPG